MHFIIKNSKKIRTSINRFLLFKTTVKTDYGISTVGFCILHDVLFIGCDETTTWWSVLIQVRIYLCIDCCFFKSVLLKVYFSSIVFIHFFRFLFNRRFRFCYKNIRYSFEQKVWYNLHSKNGQNFFIVEERCIRMYNFVIFETLG